MTFPKALRANFKLPEVLHNAYIALSELEQRAAPGPTRALHDISMFLKTAHCTALGIERY
jgi:hypothetical protein